MHQGHACKAGLGWARRWWRLDRRRDPLHWFRVRAQGSRDSRSGSTAAGQAAAGCVARMPAAAGRPRLRRTPSRRRNGVRANSIPRAEFDPLILFLFLFDPLFLCVRDSIASMRQVCTRLMTCRRMICEARTDAGSRYGALQRLEFGRSGHPHGAGRMADCHRGSEEPERRVCSALAACSGGESRKGP